MDNYSVHRGEAVRKLIEQAGAQRLYLPPYLSDISPIENGWSKLKSILTNIGPRHSPGLAKAIEVAFSQVFLEDIQGWSRLVVTAPQKTIKRFISKPWY